MSSLKRRLKLNTNQFERLNGQVSQSNLVDSYVDAASAIATPDDDDDNLGQHQLLLPRQPESPQPVNEQEQQQQQKQLPVSKPKTRNRLTLKSASTRTTLTKRQANLKTLTEYQKQLLEPLHLTNKIREVSNFRYQYSSLIFILSVISILSLSPTNFFIKLRFVGRRNANVDTRVASIYSSDGQQQQQHRQQQQRRQLDLSSCLAAPATSRESGQSCLASHLSSDSIAVTNQTDDQIDHLASDRAGKLSCASRDTDAYYHNLSCNGRLNSTFSSTAAAAYRDDHSSRKEFSIQQKISNFALDVIVNLLMRLQMFEQYVMVAGGCNFQAEALVLGKMAKMWYIKKKIRKIGKKLRKSTIALPVFTAIPIYEHSYYPQPYVTHVTHQAASQGLASSYAPSVAQQIGTVVSSGGQQSVSAAASSPSQQHSTPAQQMVAAASNEHPALQTIAFHHHRDPLTSSYAGQLQQHQQAAMMAAAHQLSGIPIHSAAIYHQLAATAGMPHLAAAASTSYPTTALTSQTQIHSPQATQSATGVPATGSSPVVGAIAPPLFVDDAGGLYGYYGNAYHRHDSNRYHTIGSW